MDLAWTRLGLTPASSLSTELCQIKSLPEPSTGRKRNGRDLARHGHLETRDICSPLCQQRVQAVTSLNVLINLEVYLHNGRGTEGNGRDDKHSSQRSSRKRVFDYQLYPHNGRETEGERKGNGRDSKNETSLMHRFFL